MTIQLTVFTSISASYSDSSELQLCQSMLQKSLPFADWIIHNENSNTTFRDTILENLPDTGHLLFIKEPAFLMGDGMLLKLTNHLQNNSDILIVIPGDRRNSQGTPQPNFHTLFGFESYTRELAHLNPALIKFDDREPWIFLINAKTFSQINLPDDPFDLPRQLPIEQVAIAIDTFIHPFLNYYNETRAELLDFVPETIDSLLDIGCSRGGFADLVKKKFNCRVTGIEMNPYEASFAKAKLDQVWVGDVFSLDISESFDCISCLDVLEHLSNPEQLLHTIKKWLKPNGTVLLSVPNVGFWAIVQDLLAGRWDYVPAGILCNTHLRFYTQHSLRHLLTDNGYRIIAFENQQLPIPENLKTGFDEYKNTGLTIDTDNLSTISFTVLAEPC